MLLEIVFLSTVVRIFESVGIYSHHKELAPGCVDFIFGKAVGAGE